MPFYTRAHASLNTALTHLHFSSTHSWWLLPGKLTYDESNQSGKWSCGMNVLSSWKHWRPSVTLTAPERFVQRFGRPVVDGKVGSIPQIEGRRSVSAHAHPKKLTFHILKIARWRTCQPAWQNSRRGKPANPQRATRWPRACEGGNKKENYGGLQFGKSRRIESMMIALCNDYNASNILLARKHFMAPLIKFVSAAGGQRWGGGGGTRVCYQGHMTFPNTAWICRVRRK